MEEPPEILAPQPNSATPPGMSLAGRLFNVFATPSEVFAELKTRPPSAWNWLAPALALILVSWIGAALIFSQPVIRQQMNEISEQAIQKQVQRGQLSPQQAEQMREVSAKFAGLGQKAAAALAPIAVGFASPFVWGFFVWLVGVKALRGNFGYMKAVEAVGLGNMIGVLDAVARSLLILAMGNLFASPSLALLVKHFDPQNPLHGLLALANVMTFWLLSVRALAVARLAEASVFKAELWVFGIWMAYTGLFWGFGVAMRAVFAR